MWKAFKYRIYGILSDKKFIFITIVYFLILNIQLLVNSGVIYQGSENYNKLLKYTLLINNFDIVSILFGLIVAIYIGTGLIGEDIETGQIYVILTASPKRYKYFIGNWLGLFIITIMLVALMDINFIVEAYTLQIEVVYSDLLRSTTDIILNMTVIMTLTAVTSIFLKGYLSAFVGLGGLLLFNIYTFSEIPFVNTPIMFKDRYIQDFLSNFCPIAYVNAPSVVGDEVTAYYSFTPIISNFSLYQVAYIVVLLILGNFLFQKKEL